MTKKQRRQQTQLPKPVLALIIGGILLVAVALFFPFGGGGDGGGTPKLAVDQEKIDYGDVKFGVKKTFAIKVTNTGDGVLRFKEKPYIQILEGC
jgi:hypothetical protein